MNKLLYFFLSLLVTFKSFPVLVFFCIEDEKGISFILNKSKKKYEHQGVALGPEELRNIKEKVNNNDTLTAWCRDFSIKHIDFLDKEKLKNKVFDYACADTVEFLGSVFGKYEVEIYIPGTDNKFNKIEKHSEFLEYICSGENVKSTYLYLCIYFSASSDLRQEIINDDYAKIEEARDSKDKIMDNIEKVCNGYSKYLLGLPPSVSYSINFSYELENRINTFFDEKNFDKNNLTGMSFVNEELNSEIRNIKEDFIRQYEEIIKKKRLNLLK